MLAVVLSGKFLSSLFFFLALFLYKVPKNEKDEENSGDKTTETDKEETPPPPTPLVLNFSQSGTLRSNHSVNTALTMLSADSTPTTPASPNGQMNTGNWSKL